MITNMTLFESDAEVFYTTPEALKKIDLCKFCKAIYMQGYNQSGLWSSSLKSHMLCF